ncbi:uncharacterized protein E0L32_006643 [Thyridium curvatum]|uniref:N,N-dimethylformamidase beta subunit-like C-terminal domain-containing protein n=1 Tax=Thyridium curvatum TaxID=1093900 RepID=A0A507B897_9PEZI|nr:uncharacterized protein E0L32_006643 [Thyridium curvatum]TPX12998.1 hypothetical protein E0L32_006643 [Thyridium curvatum]
MASTLCSIPEGYPAEIIGYADPWIASPGDMVEIKVSSTAARYCYRTVRLIQGLDVPNAAKVHVEEVLKIHKNELPGRFQQAHPGSYGVVPGLIFRPDEAGVAVSFFAQPYLIDPGHDQTMVSLVDREGHSGVSIVLRDGGYFAVRIGIGQRLIDAAVDYSILRKQWIKINIVVLNSTVDVTIEPVLHLGQKRGQYHQQHIELPAPMILPPMADLVIAALRPRPGLKASDFFNGRIESLRVSACGASQRLLVDLDFSLKISSDNIVDISGNGGHGSLINAPSRAVRGHNWDGSETDWTKAKYDYGAIHFHEDDLDDANWDTDFAIEIPQDARSGAYAVEVCSTEDPSVKDSIVFFVRPRQDSTAKLALVLSTFTYTAYANEHMYDQSKSSQLALIGQSDPRADSDFRRMVRRTDLGLSLYDVHRDGSGSVFSSTKRPVLNVRPGFHHWAFNRPREFSADLLMIGFLEQLGIPYDVTVDHELHAQGVRAIERYSTVITGSHPEYPTLQSLNAYSEFAARGGNIMYLGGNGFYWLSVLDPANPHRLEVRRGDQGVRTFQLPGGERHHSLNGAQGGLWRSRGRAANYLFGVGCCGEGIGPGVPFRRTAHAADARFAWVFEGIGEDELIGEHGFGGGASGDEIDRYDVEHGSPESAVVLATSIGHPDGFALFPEDIGFQELAVTGSQTNKIRSDIVIYETPAGGQVFSVGSMNWYCSLGWDSYDNNVARLTGNVIRKFTGSQKSTWV